MNLQCLGPNISLYLWFLVNPCTFTTAWIITSDIPNKFYAKIAWENFFAAICPHTMKAEL